jgi:hypothetical protein
MLKRPLADPVGVRRVYCDIQEFGHYLLNDLSTILYEYAAQANASRQLRTSDRTSSADIGWSPGDHLVMELAEDQPYVMSVLSVEIENHDSLAKYLTYNQLNLLKKRFREFVNRIVVAYHGDQLKLTERGGMYGFWQENRFNQAIMAAAYLFQELPGFETRKIFNSPLDPVKITVAGSDGLTSLKRSRESLFFYNLNSVLYAKDVEAGGSRFFINEALYKRIEENLRTDFTYNKRIAGEPVYLWLRGQQDSHPSLLTLGKFFRAIVSKKTYLENILNHTFSKMDQRMLETLSANLDVIYSGLEQFYDWFSRQPVNAEKEYSLQLTDYLRRLEEFEDSLWRQLRRRFNQVNTQASENRHFIELLRAINSRRTHLIVRINNLLQAQTSPALAVAQTRALAKPALAPASGGTGKGFKELLTKFIISDDLDSLDALSEVFFRYRSELVRLLGNDSNIGEKTRSHLLKRFWKFAHIVLIEDHYYLERPVPDEQPGSVFQSLSRTANTHNGFLRIQQLIQQPKEQVLAFLQQLPLLMIPRQRPITAG